MLRKSNLYERLDLGKDASPGDIKQSFRRKAKAAHPDVGGDPQEFRDLSEAYAILSAPDKRERYDETGKVDGADNERAFALSIIQNLLSEILDQVDDRPVMQDIVEVMRAQLRKNLESFRDAERELRQKAERTERFAKRFKVKKSKAKVAGSNVLRDVVEAKAREMRQTIARGEGRIQANTLALKILDDCEFEPEAMNVIFNGTVFTGNMFSSSSTA